MKKCLIIPGAGLLGGSLAAGAIITKAVTFGAIGAGVYGVIKVLKK